jgi:hypothetical protein
VETETVRTYFTAIKQGFLLSSNTTFAHSCTVHRYSGLLYRFVEKFVFFDANTEMTRRIACTDCVNICRINNRDTHYVCYLCLSFAISCRRNFRVRLRLYYYVQRNDAAECIMLCARTYNMSELSTVGILVHTLIVV